MKKFQQILVILFLILNSKGSFGQISSDKLYDKLDAFVENPTLKKAIELEKDVVLFKNKALTKDDFLALTIVYNNLGYYYSQFGRLKESILNYEEAWSIYENQKLSNYDIFQNCLLPLSKLYTQQGDFLKAEELLKRCYFHSEKQKNSHLLVQTTLSLSALYNTLGNFNAAISSIEKGLSQKTISPELQQLAQNNLATSYIGLKKFDKAKELLLAIISRTNGNQLNSYKNLAFIAIQEQNFELATAYFNKAKEYIRTSSNTNPRDLIYLTVEEAELQIAINEIKEAQETLKSALKLLIPNYAEKGLPPKEKLYAERSFIRIFDVYASTLETTKEILGAYDLSFYVENLMVQNYSSQDTKILHQTSHKKRTEKCIDVLWKDYLLNKNDEFIKTAFQYAENSKASVLSQKIYENNSNTVSNTKQKQLIAQREKLLDDLLRIQFKKLGEVEVTKVVAGIQKIERELNVLNADKSDKSSDAEIDFKSIQTKLLKDNASLLSYFIGNATSYVFTVDRHQIEMTKLLESDTLETEIRKFIRFFDSPSAINNNVSEFTNTASKTYEILHLNSAQKTKNLILIPDGLLNFLPFESLLTNSSSTISFAEMPFLVQQHAVGYSYNVYDYLDTKKTIEKNSILGVFPVFENTPQALNFSIDEASSIQKYFDIQSLFKEKATKSNFLNEAKNASLLHLCTHASSGNFIVPAHLQFIDDMLYLPELYSLDMTNKTVILSACETGIGKLQSGEGAISVARAFKYAGASKIAFTLWEVNDKSTAQIMEEFYKLLKENNSIFQANREAKLAYLNNSDIPNLKKSPYFWNSFVYYGPIDFLTKKTNYLLWFIVTFASLILVIIIWKFKRTKK